MEAHEREGWLWYTNARAIVYGLASHYGRDPKVVAGVFAALSPRTQWDTNVARANAALKTGKASGGLPLGVKRAQEILDGGDPWYVLRGPKVRAFYRALLGDDKAVTIDAWMLRALGFPHEKPTPLQVKRLDRRVRHMASKKGIPPAVMQAIIWCKERSNG